MVAVGQEMANPITGERFVWRDTRESTAGSWCEFDLHLAVNAKVAATHRHPLQEERFSIISGGLEVDVDGSRRTAGPGDTVVVPAGAAHR